MPWAERQMDVYVFTRELFGGVCRCVGGTWVNKHGRTMNGLYYKCSTVESRYEK